jgi:hypothetical protein
MADENPLLKGIIDRVDFNANPAGSVPKAVAWCTRWPDGTSFACTETLAQEPCSWARHKCLTFRY